jgi:hypothetical protein
MVRAFPQGLCHMTINSLFLVPANQAVLTGILCSRMQEEQAVFTLSLHRSSVSSQGATLHEHIGLSACGSLSPPEPGMGALLKGIFTFHFIAPSNFQRALTIIRPDPTVLLPNYRGAPALGHLIGIQKTVLSL